MKKILVTGANGFLGQHLVLYLQKRGFDVLATGRGASRLPGSAVNYYSTDLTDGAAISKLIKDVMPDVIIHNAAMSKPDECENNKEECVKVNYESLKYMVNGKVEHLLYLSTDFIFGEGGPHAEDDTPGPLNYYGETKLKAEQLLQQYNGKSTVVRPVFIYGRTWEGLRPSFVHWVKNNLEQKKQIKVVSDQQRTPTFVTDICTGIATIIDQQETGVYNLAGKDILSPYEMAVKTAGVLKLDAGLIEKVTAETFPEPVKRAKRSGLKIDKAIKDLEYDPVSFEEGIRRTFLDNY